MRLGLSRYELVEEKRVLMLKRGVYLQSLTEAGENQNEFTGY